MRIPRIVLTTPMELMMKELRGRDGLINSSRRCSSVEDLGAGRKAKPYHSNSIAWSLDSHKK